MRGSEQPVAKADNAFESIARRIDPRAEHVRHWPLTGGVSAQIQAIEFSLPGGQSRRVVVRRHGAAQWKPLEDDVTSTEFALQKNLNRAGLPVPEPLLLDVSGELLPSPYFVMPMVEGTTDVDAYDLPEALRQMADFLLRLHNTDVETLVHIHLPRGEDPVSGALKYLPASQTALREAIARWVTTPGEMVLLHGDYWPGNVMWNRGELAAVIDWEDAGIGPAVSDLAGCRSELRAIYGETAMETFTERYRTGTTHEMSDLPVWEVYAGSAALASMADWGLDPEVEALRRRRTVAFVDRAAREIVDRATREIVDQA